MKRTATEKSFDQISMLPHGNKENRCAISERRRFRRRSRVLAELGLHVPVSFPIREGVKEEWRITVTLQFSVAGHRAQQLQHGTNQ